MAYAANTSVSAEKSRQEIESLLQRTGVEQLGYLSQNRTGIAAIAFTRNQCHYRIEIKLPSRDEKRFQATHGGSRKATQQQSYKAWDQECRRLWRSLHLVVKGLLVAVEDRVMPFEQAFLPWLVWGDGLTVTQKLLPIVEEVQMTGGRLPLSLPAPKEEAASDRRSR